MEDFWGTAFWFLVGFIIWDFVRSQILERAYYQIKRMMKTLILNV